MVSREQFREALAGVCAPVTVVTTYVDGLPFGARIRELGPMRDEIRASNPDVLAVGVLAPDGRARKVEGHVGESESLPESSSDAIDRRPFGPTVPSYLSFPTGVETSE